jgi:hypothetical protein
MLQLKKPAVDRNYATHKLWVLMRKFNDNVAAPRLAADNRTNEPSHCQHFQQFCKIKSYGLHVVTVIGFVAQPMSTQIDRNNRVTKRNKCLRGALPQHGIRSEAMNQH